MLTRGRSTGGASLAANALGRLWALVANLIMFPVYLRLLGQENFGIVALLAAVTAIVALFDFGLTPVFARELNDQARDMGARTNLLFTAEVAFGVIVALIVTTVLLLPASLLLLVVNEGPSQPVQLGALLRLVFIVAAAQLLFNFYVTAMSGMEAQVRSNMLSIGISLLRSVGAVAPLLVWPDIEVFLYWQVGTTVLGVLLARYAAYGLLDVPGVARKSRFIWHEIRHNLPTATAAFALAAAASLNMNVDKIFVGKQLGLSQIAEYSIVATFAQLIFIAIVPITMTVTPRMVRSVTGHDQVEFQRLLSLTRSGIAIVSAALTTIFWWHGPQLIQSWSGGVVRAAAISGYANWLFVGFACLSISSIYHCVAVANKDFSFGRYYIFSILVVLPLYWLAIDNYGVAGGAIAWALTQFVIMAAYVMWVRHRWLRQVRSGPHAFFEALVSAGFAAALCGFASAFDLDRMGTPILVLVVVIEAMVGAVLTHFAVRALVRGLGFPSALSSAVDSQIKIIFGRHQRA